jgi:hypothetical protein
MGILYSIWLILAVGAIGITVIGVGKLLSDKDSKSGDYAHVSGIDVAIFIVGVGVCFLTGVTASALDFLCSSSAASCVNGVQTYTNMWPFTWVFASGGLVNLFFAVVSIVLMLRNRVTR